MIGSARSEVGLPDGMRVLRGGGHALDAVEAAMRTCEDNPDDHYVGTGGLPNALGVVELDASVMVGSTRAFAAVAAVRGYPNPISIARAVMEKLPQHCLLVGAGAEEFAAENGFQTANLLTDEARRLYETALEPPADGSSTSTPESERYRLAALDMVRRMRPHDGPWGTINILALDTHGEIVVGVSTSGFPWKYPGRVGDSALPGAGIYCDARFGGAACTGRGEMAMRVLGAKHVVDALARGTDPDDACREMLVDAASLVDPFASDLRTLCLTPAGHHAAATLRDNATYAAMGPGDAEPQILPATTA
jgi:beta-aspartyl-peptidase (threonine type)